MDKDNKVNFIEGGWDIPSEPDESTENDGLGQLGCHQNKPETAPIFNPQPVPKTTQIDSAASGESKPSVGLVKPERIDGLIEISVSVNAKVVLEKAEMLAEQLKKITERHSWPTWVREDKVNKIKHLKSFYQVHDKVCQGEPDIEIARYIQGEAGELASLNVATVRNFVSNYRATVPPALIFKARYPEKFKESAVELKERLNTSLDLIAECQKLYDIQFSRISSTLVAEKVMNGILFSSTHKEIQAALEILREIASIRKELGISGQPDNTNQEKRHPRELIDFDSIYGRTGFNKVIDDPKSRMKVMQTVERIFMLYNGKLDGEVPAAKEIKEVKPSSAPVKESVIFKRVEGTV